MRGMEMIAYSTGRGMSEDDEGEGSMGRIGMKCMWGMSENDEGKGCMRRIGRISICGMEPLEFLSVRIWCIGMIAIDGIALSRYDI
jgi:hypothetical protein